MSNLMRTVYRNGPGNRPVKVLAKADWNRPNRYVPATYLDRDLAEKKRLEVVACGTEATLILLNAEFGEGVYAIQVA